MILLQHISGIRVSSSTIALVVMINKNACLAACFVTTDLSCKIYATKFFHCVASLQ